jgi:hypothetical protein
VIIVRLWRFEIFIGKCRWFPLYDSRYQVRRKEKRREMTLGRGNKYNDAISDIPSNISKCPTSRQVDVQ